jgi:transposase
VIDVICDNYQPHVSRTTRLWLAEHGARLRLHFLPPYCPDDNRIERRVWREVHANVIGQALNSFRHCPPGHFRTRSQLVRLAP